MPLHDGVYAGLKGPSLETPAEIRFLTTIGADAVGLSTVMEVIAAVHAGMRILGLSVITNVNHPDHPEPATLEDIIAAADRAAPGLARLIAAILERLS
jgi:purine-nucleoside phosphorylase